jgi:hypothetical protein
MPDFGIFRGFNDKLFGDKLYAGQLPINLGLIGSQEVFNFDPDYQAVLDYATTQGYTLPSESQQLLQNQLVVDLKDGGIWNKLDSLGIYATDGSSNFALIDWKRLSLLTAVNSPTFTTNQGFNGNGTSSYINSNYNPFTNGINYTQNSASMGVYLLGNPNGDFCYIGGLATAAIIALINPNRGTFPLGRMNDSTAPFPTTSITTTGFISQNRPNSTTRNIYANGSLHQSQTIVSTGTPNANYYILAFNENGPAVLKSTAKVSMHYCGSDLTPNQSDFSTAINTYINSL